MILNTEDALFDVAEVAEKLSLKEDSVRSHARKLRMEKRRGQWWFTQEQIDRIAERVGKVGRPKA